MPQSSAVATCDCTPSLLACRCQQLSAPACLGIQVDDEDEDDKEDLELGDSPKAAQAAKPAKPAKVLRWPIEMGRKKGDP